MIAATINVATQVICKRKRVEPMGSFLAGNDAAASIVARNAVAQYADHHGYGDKTVANAVAAP